MDDIKQIKQKELEIIADYNKEEVMHIIDTLTSKYYLAYMDKDFATCKSYISFIHDIIYMFEEDMQYLEQYTNYSMLQTANQILKIMFQKDYDLECYSDVEVKSTSGVRNLANTIKEAQKMKINNVDKMNIKYLHDICAVDETVDENIVDIVDALYTSFNSKDNTNDADTIASGD